MIVSRNRQPIWLIFLTVLVFLLSQTSVLSENEEVSAARWIVLSLYCFAVIWFSLQQPLRKLYVFDGLIVFFILYAIASSAYSIEPDLTLLRGLSLLLLYVAVFWGVWCYANRYGEEKIINTLVVAAALIYCLSLLLIPFVELTRQADGRFRGILMNPNALGLLTVIFLPPVLWRVLHYKRWFDAALLVGIIVCLVLSSSRTGFLASLIGAIYLLSKARFKHKKLIVCGLFLALLCAGYILAIESPNEPAASNKDMSLTARLDLSRVRTGGGRMEAWSVAWPIIQEELLTGHGFGTEELIFEKISYDFTVHEGSYIHNSYLGIAFQLGLPGLALLFVPLVLLLMRQLWASRHDSTLTLAHAFQGVLLGGLVAASFESWIYSVGNAFTFPFWVCVMLLIRRSIIQREPLAAMQGLRGGRGQQPPAAVYPPNSAARTRSVIG